MAPDPLDMCTLADVAAQRRDRDGTHSPMLQALITAASAAINEWTDRRITPLDPAPVEQVIDHPVWIAATRELLIPDLAAPPTAAAIEGPDGLTLTTLTVATDLVAVPRTRAAWEPITRLRWRPNTPGIPAGGAVVVTGRWGFPEIPPTVRQAAVVTVVEWAKTALALTSPSPDQFEPGTPPARALPMVARNLLAAYRIPGAA